MNVPFHMLCVFIIERTTPGWQRDIIQITREVVQALRDAETPKKK